MKKLFAFEMRKIWQGRIWVPPVLLAGMILLIILALRIEPSSVFNGFYRKVNDATRPWWGMTVTEEIRQQAAVQAEAYGAVYREEFGFSYLDTSPVFEKYGDWSVELNAAVALAQLVNNPTLDEERQDHQDMILFTEQRVRDGTASLSEIRLLDRQIEPSFQQIAPTYCAWDYFLSISGGYAVMVVGLGTMAMMLVFFSDVFSREEGGGMAAVCMSKPRRRQWIWAKILSVAASGALLTLFMTGGLLLAYGLIFGFQGWNLNALNYVGVTGYTYGMLNVNVTTLELSLIKLAWNMAAGVCLALTVAGFSALVRNATAAAGLSAAALLAQVVPAYILTAYERSHQMTPEHNLVDWTGLHAFCQTPIRYFLDVDMLMMRVDLEASLMQDGTVFYNTLVTPDLALATGATMLLVTLAGLAACLVYERLATR